MWSRTRLPRQVPVTPPGEHHVHHPPAQECRPLRSRAAQDRTPRPAQFEGRLPGHRRRPRRPTVLAPGRSGPLPPPRHRDDRRAVLSVVGLAAHPDRPRPAPAGDRQTRWQATAGPGHHRPRHSRHSTGDPVRVALVDRVHLRGSTRTSRCGPGSVPYPPCGPADRSLRPVVLHGHRRLVDAARPPPLRRRRATPTSPWDMTRAEPSFADTTAKLRRVSIAARFPRPTSSAHRRRNPYCPARLGHSQRRHLRMTYENDDQPIRSDSSTMSPSGPRT